jgi:hypothetical protein
MNDRELLQLAAKAAQYNLRWHENGIDCWSDNRAESYWAYWNPLTDDGDALRLAVKLHLTMATDDDGCSISCELPRTINEENPADVYAATRRAIVRAAAELAKETK